MKVQCPAMIVASAPAFRDAVRALALEPLERSPVPRAALLVAPDAFAIAPESARDNRYMQLGGVDLDRARAQHAALAAAIRATGVPVTVLPGVAGQPDGVFPNNVFATTPRRVIVGAMRHDVRRREAERRDVRSLLTALATSGRGVRREVLDLSTSGCVAELTGPLVMDRKRGIGFCGMTERVDDAGVIAMHEAFELALTYRFPLAPGEYHTNVVLSLLAGRACVLHRASFADPETPAAIESLYAGATIELDDAEKAAFAANCIALTNRDVFLSATAERALRSGTKARFDALGFARHAIEVDEIEKAGGSVRCMIAEVF